MALKYLSHFLRNSNRLLDLVWQDDGWTLNILTAAKTNEQTNNIQSVIST